MSGAARLGDWGGEHDLCRPVQIISGSNTVFVDGKPAARVGDVLEEHDCFESVEHHPSHIPTIVTGSNTVFVDGRPAAKVGSKTSCLSYLQSEITTGSNTVFYS